MMIFYKESWHYCQNDLYNYFTHRKFFRFFFPYCLRKIKSIKWNDGKTWRRKIRNTSISYFKKLFITSISLSTYNFKVWCLNLNAVYVYIYLFLNGNMQIWITLFFFFYFNREIQVVADVLFSPVMSVSIICLGIRWTDWSLTYTDMCFHKDGHKYKSST